MVPHGANPLPLPIYQEQSWLCCSVPHNRFDPSTLVTNFAVEYMTPQSLTVMALKGIRGKKMRWEEEGGREEERERGGECFQGEPSRPHPRPQALLSGTEVLPCMD